jgi:hypothetical protein
MHVLEAARGLVHPREMTVMGSTALLALGPDLGESGQPLELSLDADVLVEPFVDREAAVLHEAIGEGSLFHREYGVYLDLLRPQIAATLPPGWRLRRWPIEGASDALFLDPYDVALAKLVLGREKDLTLLHSLVQSQRIDLAKLRSRFGATPLNESELFNAGLRLNRLAADPGRAGSPPTPSPGAGPSL